MNEHKIRGAEVGITIVNDVRDTCSMLAVPEEVLIDWDAKLAANMIKSLGSFETTKPLKVKGKHGHPHWHKGRW